MATSGNRLTNGEPPESACRRITASNNPFQSLLVLIDCAHNPGWMTGVLGYFPLDPQGEIREEAVKYSSRDSFPYPPHSVKIKKEIVVAV